MTSQTRISELANIISISTNEINEFLQTNNLPQPSFEIDGPIQPIPTDNAALQKARTLAIEASIELQQLLQGVDNLLLPEKNMASLQAVTRFKIATHVPPDSQICFPSLAFKTGFHEHNLIRIIRFAISHHRVFCEPENGFVAHSAASKRLFDSDFLQHISGLTFDEVWPAHAKVVDALTHFNKSQKLNESGFALANNTNLPFYQYIKQFPDRAKRFGGAMSSAGTSGLVSLAEGFSWSRLPPSSTVLDVGGSQGHVSGFLAEKFPSLNFIVQDLPEVISERKESTYRLPNGLDARVKLVAHDFFELQDIGKTGEVHAVLLRYVLHNWSDNYCVKILRNLIPVLKKGASIIVQYHLLPEPRSLSLLEERRIRSMDMIMLTLFNARERDQEDRKRLFELADGNFKFASAKRAQEHSPPAVIIATWKY